MLKALRRVGLWNVAIVLGMVSLTVALLNEQRNREILSHSLAQSQLRESQIAMALRTEVSRAGKLEQLLASKSQEVGELISRLEVTTRQLSSLGEKIQTRDRQISQLQTDLLLAQDAGAGSASRRDAKEAARIELEKIAVTRPAIPSPNGRVVQVNPDWDFVVVDLGWDALSIGDRLNIYRNDHLIAQAQVERLQETASAARVLPPYQIAKVQTDDSVTLEAGR